MSLNFYDTIKMPIEGEADRMISVCFFYFD